MFGRNTSTPPTPPMMPSTSSIRRNSACPAGQIELIPLPSAQNSISSQSIGYWPTVKVNMKTRYIITRKIGTPRNRFVTYLSMVSESWRRRSLLIEIASRQAPAITP